MESIKYRIGGSIMATKKETKTKKKTVTNPVKEKKTKIQENQKMIEKSKKEDSKKNSTNQTKEKKSNAKSIPTKKDGKKELSKVIEKKEVSKKKSTNVKKKGTTKKTEKKVPKFSTVTNLKVEKEKASTKKADAETKKDGKSKEKKALFPFFKRKKAEKRKIEKKQAEKTKKKKIKEKKQHFQFLKKQKSKKSKNKKEQKKNSSELVLLIKTNKWLKIMIGICATIILIEGIYLLILIAQRESQSVYYDSLNSLVLDNQDIVAVGSSNFKYSKENDYTKGLEKGKLIKYDKDGKIIFEKMYEKGINTTFSSIITISDGYIVVGSGEFSEKEQEDEGREAFIIKYSKDGEILWEKFYSVLTNTRFNKVIQTQDGNFIAIGQSIYANMELGNHTTGGGIIVKYDQEGNEIWHNNHGGTKSGNFNGIVEVDGNFYVVGKDASDSGNIVKYDANGIYQWHKNYSYTDGLGLSDIVYQNNGLYVVGSKKILPEGITDDDNRDTNNTDAVLIKYDLEGNIIFEKTFGGSNFERYNDIFYYRDKLYAVGHTTSEDAGLKTDTKKEYMTGIIIRYDLEGNIEKKDALGGSHDDNLTEIYTDGVSIYIAGYSNSKNGNISTSKNNGKDYFGKMIKLDMKFRTLMIR